MAGTTLFALMLAAALNPLVVRLPEPSSNVPEDCAVSDRPAPPRVRVADAEPREPAAPLPRVRPVAAQTASAAGFDELDRAIANNDRPAFDAALARARAAGLPTRKYDDVARLWDAQFESPFFAQDSDAYRVASQYPGYEEAMRPHVFTDASGRKFYPAAESRRFVAGMRPVTTARPPAQTTRRASTSPASPPSASAAPAPSRGTTRSRPNVAAQRRTTGSTRGKTSRTETTRPAPTPSRSESRQPAASRDPAAPSSSPDPSAPPQPAATDPAPAASTVVDTSSTETPPAAGSLDPAAPAPVPATTTEAAPATDTPATTTPKSEGRPIILPAILILIGLGVLILLFRAKA